MGKYSIKELEKLSGIKAHTIRIWEKRYNVIEPQRTSTNIRYYSDYDLKRIINVSMLNTSGVKISAIVEMTDDELNERVRQLGEGENLTNIHIDQLITAMIDLDEAIFEKEFQSLESKFGFERMVIEVVYPFLNKIGVLWQTGNITPAHEHFVSNLIRQKIIVAIASLPLPSKNALRAMLFLPENELHELGLLFYHYLARKLGYKTYYLGQCVPYADVKVVYEVHRPHLLITSMTSNPSPNVLNDYLYMLSQDFSKSRILAAGILLKKTSFNFPPNLKVFDTAIELKAFLKELV